MTTINITILGLDRLGASIGMALKRYNARKDAQHSFKVSGADTRDPVQQKARKIGAVDDLARNFYDAVQNRDIVVLAVPYAEAKDAYDVIGSGMRSGAVLLDASPLKQPSLEWAKKYLPDGVHQIGITAILNPQYLFDGLDDTEHARADLFDNGNLLLMPNVGAAREAVDLAANFAGILGAKPHFADPAEHDSLVASTEGLPALLGIAVFYALYKSEGWSDMQRFTNPGFGRLTHHLYDTHPDDLRDAWLNNRENLIRALDGLVDTLRTFRQVLVSNDRDALEAAVIDSAEAYEQWLNRRHRAQWDDARALPKTPPMGNLMSGLVGGYIADRLPGGKNDQDGDK